MSFLVKSRLWRAAAVAALLVGALPFAVSAAPAGGSSYLVGLRDGNAADNLRAAGFNLKFEFGRERAANVITDAQGAQRLRNNANVSYVEPDRLVHADARFTDSGEITWGLQAIKAPNAWTTSTGSGVTVCVLDTGLDLGHQEFVGANVLASANFVNDGHRTAQDGNGHGTHVAGTVAAQPNGFGVTGVAYDVDLLIARVLGDDGSGPTSGVVRGVNWCVDQGADILSLSLGSDAPSITEERAFQAAWDLGRLSIAASGNDSSTAPHYPSSYSTVVAVGAVDSSLKLASFSNYGPKQEVVAPGVDVYSSYPRGFGRLTTMSEDGTIFVSKAVEYTPATSGPINAPLIECGLALDTTSCTTKPATGDWIAMISRGQATFAAKVQNVMAQGAKAAIIANNDTANPDDAGSFTLGAPGTWIPTVSVSYNSGVSIRKRGLGAGSVNIVATDYEYIGGTSQATPHVSGTAALAWAANPALTNAQVRAILGSTATDLGTRGRDDVFGYGLVQADAAVSAALTTP